MSFTIKTNLQWGEIFAGKFDVPMHCELSLSPEYYLIYSNLDTSGSLDLASLFNTAFDTHLTGSFTVNEAGFFTYSKMPQNQSNSPGRPLSESFPNAPLPATVKQSARPVLQTTSFWASFDIKTSGLFNTLLQVGYDEGSTITLSGTFASEEEAGKAVTTTSYEAHFDYIKLLSLFEFKDLTLKYRFDQSAEYRIYGDLSITLFKDSGGGNYVFLGDVHSTKERLTASLSSKDSSSEIVNPFGFMKGVTFKNLLFGLVYTYKTETEKGQGAYRVQGSIAYKSEDPKTSFGFTGQIFLSGTTPLVAAMFIDQDLDIGAIFNNTFGSIITWPTDFINLVFHKNSQLYYCKDAEIANKISRTTFEFQPDIPPDPNNPISNTTIYQDGFNLDALFDLTILTTIKNIHGKIQVLDKGVKASIQLADMIDLWVLQIKAPQLDPPAPAGAPNGPFFEFESDQNKMGFNCGLEFFQADFGLNIDVKGWKDKTSSKNSMALEGSLQSATSHEPFIPKGAKLTFSYDKKNGFKVKGWEEFTFISEVIDYIEEIRKIANKSGSNACGKIAAFAFDQVKNSYKMSPDFVTENDQLYMVLNGTYSVSVNLPGGEVNIFDIKFPQMLKFQLPDDVSFNNLGNIIEQALKDAATSFAQAVIDNPDAIASFLVILGGQQAAQYGATLVCRGVSQSSVAAATEAGASALAGAGGLAAGAGAALGAIAIIGGITGGGGGGGKPHQSCFIAGTKIKLANGQIKNIEDIQIGDVLLGANNAQNEVLAFDHPPLGDRALYRFNQSGDYFVTAEHPFLTTEGWKSIDPAATAAENPNLSVTMLQIGDRLVLENGGLYHLRHLDQKTSDPNTQLYNFKLSGNRSYIANDFFVHNKGGDDTPDQPNPATIGYAESNINFSWHSAARAKNYNARLTDVKGTVLQDQPNLPANQTSTKFPVASALPAGSYFTQVRALNGDKASGFSAFGIEKPVTPTLTISCDRSDLRASSYTLKLSWAVVLRTKAYLLHMDALTKGISIDPKDYFKDGHYLPVTHDIPITDATPAGKASYALSLQSDGSYIDSNISSAQIWQRLANVQSFNAAIYLNDPSGQPTLKINWVGQAGDQEFYLYLEQKQETSAPATVSYHKGATLSYTSPLIDFEKLSYISTKIRVLSNKDQGAAPTTNQIPSAWSQAILLQAPVPFATEAFNKKQDGRTCATGLIRQYPDITPTQMAKTMAKGGYPADQTSQGLKQAYPDITAEQLTNALVAAYGIDQNTPEKMAKNCAATGVSGADCGTKLIQNFPHLVPDQMALVMANAPYPADATAQGLKAAYPNISATDLTNALTNAYGKQENTPLSLAQEGYKDKLSGEDCAHKIYQQYPQILPQNMADVMAVAGYSADQTGAGLKAIYPNLTALDFTKILQGAYG